jgi:hypothetical protein
MDIAITTTVIVAVIIGLSEAIKRATNINAKFIPVLDIVLGLLGAVVYSFIEPMAWPYVVFHGLIMGLTACGLFSAGKNVLEGTKGE